MSKAKSVAVWVLWLTVAFFVGLLLGLELLV
jgi:hypothetical protein